MEVSEKPVHFEFPETKIPLRWSSFAEPSHPVEELENSRDEYRNEVLEQAKHIRKLEKEKRKLAKELKIAIKLIPPHLDPTKDWVDWS